MQSCVNFFVELQSNRVYFTSWICTLFWHSLVSRHILQHYVGPDWFFVEQVGMWNIGSLCGKGGEVCEELRKRMIDVYCLLEVRWRGQGSRMLGMNGWRCKM